MFKLIKKLIIVVLLVTLCWILFVVCNLAFSLYGFQPPEMAATQYAKQDAVGDLGGMPVRIPYYFANYLECEGDPSWGESRSGFSPQRSYQSKITSFGFDVRYPDMVGLMNDEMYKNQRSYTIYNTPWMSVGVNAWSHFDGGHQGLENRVRALDRDSSYFWSNFELLSEKKFGLETYAVKVEEGQNPTLIRTDENAKDIYVYRHPKTHKVETYISCGHSKIGQASCKQTFDLTEDLQVRVYFKYRREELANWQEMQIAVKKLVLSFEAPIKEKR